MQKIPVQIFPTPEAAVKSLATEVAELIKSKEVAGEQTVLGLATGSTPIRFYQELIRLHKEEGLSFQNVTTFNLDEYAGLARDHKESYWCFMHEQLFNHIDIKPENINLPSGTVEAKDIEAHCKEYEQAIVDAGGLDLQILGIGRTGHIGFNEPGSPIDSRTRGIQLDPITREDAAPAFDGLENVPVTAITMGCGTILDAKRLRLMAWGAGKAPIVNEAVTGEVTEKVSASFLQKHADSLYLLDEAAAAELEA